MGLHNRVEMIVQPRGKFLDEDHPEVTVVKVGQNGKYVIPAGKDVLVYFVPSVYQKGYEGIPE